MYYSAFNAVDMFNSARHGSNCLNLSVATHDWVKVDFLILLDFIITNSYRHYLKFSGTVLANLNLMKGDGRPGYFKSLLAKQLLTQVNQEEIDAILAPPVR